MPLRVLQLPSGITSLPPLRSSELRSLRLPENVNDISGLKGSSLRGLDLESTQVSDLSPLEGMALEYV